MRYINERWVATVTADAIYGFFGQYRFLSNFHPLPQPIIYEGRPYWTTEAAYMSGKTDDEAIKQQLSDLPQDRGRDAKKIGRSLKLRSDWNEVRDVVMYDVLFLKFSIPELREMLLATGDRYLEETNYWNDQYWGKCNGVGFNVLGSLLMMIRDPETNKKE